MYIHVHSICTNFKKAFLGWHIDKAFWQILFTALWVLRVYDICYSWREHSYYFLLDMFTEKCPWTKVTFDVVNRLGHINFFRYSFCNSDIVLPFEVSKTYAKYYRNYKCIWLRITVKILKNSIFWIFFKWELLHFIKQIKT